MRIFDVENPIFRFIGKVGDIWLLNLLWLITSLPVVTLGAATTALLGTAIKLADNTEGHIIKDYFNAFVRNFKQATLIFLLTACVGTILAADICFWANNEASESYLFLALMLGLSIPYIAVLAYVFAVQARFKNTVKDTIRNAFFMAIKHLRYTITLLLLIAVLIILNYTVLLVNYFTLMFGVGLFAYLSALVYIEVFRNYEPEPVKSIFDINDSGVTGKPAGQSGLLSRYKGRMGK